MQAGLLDKNFLFKSVGFTNPLPPATISETVPIKDAAAIMKKKNTGCCLVVRPDGTLLGILSERDIVSKVILEDTKTTAPVSAIMIKDPKTIDMTATISHVLNLMAEGGYRHVPIVDKENIPLGVVSVKNIVTFISKQLSKGLSM